jgi:hypothetical protein
MESEVLRSTQKLEPAINAPRRRRKLSGDDAIAHAPPLHSCDVAIDIVLELLNGAVSVEKLWQLSPHAIRKLLL